MHIIANRIMIDNEHMNMITYRTSNSRTAFNVAIHNLRNLESMTYLQYTRCRTRNLQPHESSQCAYNAANLLIAISISIDNAGGHGCDGDDGD